MSSKGKVTGIGGVFFKCKNPEALKQWYADHLGLNVDQYGCLFSVGFQSSEEQRSTLQWSTFGEDAPSFAPSDKQFMINYRVDDMASILEKLQAAGIEPLDEVATYDYGKFVHILDPEGNKLELWEPKDSVFIPE